MKLSPARKLSLAGVALVIIGGLALVRWYRTATGPVAESGQPVTVEIERGSGAKVIARQLQDQGLVRSAAAFEIMLALTGRSADLRAGFYELSPAMPAREIAHKLASSEVVMRRLTIPEGLTIEQIAERVGESGLATKAEFLAAAVPSKVAKLVDLRLPADSLEGYLFPETYNFELGVKPEEIAARMVRELDERFAKPYQKQIGASKRSLHEIITLASLVEREAKLPAERGLIAGVLTNRLERDTLLQCDATVQYALGQHKPRVLYDDLKVESPYNTYLHKGLPPGPIAAPGEASLQAALSPQKTDYLFYVARPDGGHIFSSTFEEHQAAIKQVRSP